jgi:hypothetical protein
MRILKSLAGASVCLALMLSLNAFAQKGSGLGGICMLASAGVI